jgi:GTP-binding protein
MTVWKSELYCTAFTKQQIPEPRNSEIVFVGRSNVGKSTLINSLLERTIAKVSSKPGKTRSINFYSVMTGDEDFTLVDIPGYGYAARGMDERRTWWRLIEDYFASDRPISFVIHLMDFRHGPLPNDNELTAWLDQMDIPRLVVFTKGDKISPGKRKGLYQQYMRAGLDSILPPFITSGINDKEMSALREGIKDILKEIAKLDRMEEKKKR